MLVTRMAKSWRVSDVTRISLAAIEVSHKNRRVSGGKFTVSITLLDSLSGLWNARIGLSSTVGKLRRSQPIELVGPTLHSRCSDPAGLPEEWRPEPIATRQRQRYGPAQVRKMRCINGDPGHVLLRF